MVAGVDANAQAYSYYNLNIDAAGSFVDFQLEFIGNNTNGSAGYVFLYMTMDDALIGSWPILIPPGRSNTAMSTIYPNPPMGNHSIRLWYCASVGGLYFSIDHYRALVLKA